MSPRFTRLAWLTAVCTYLLIVLGAIVRITGSGMGCGDHWPLCNGGLFPSLGNLGMLIEWSHRLVAALLSVLVVALAGYAWWLRRETALDRPGLAAYAALGLLALQVALGAVTVKLALPAWTVILHLGTAMLLLATLIVAARGPRLIPGSPRLRAGSVRAGLVERGQSREAVSAYLDLAENEVLDRCAMLGLPAPISRKRCFGTLGQSVRVWWRPVPGHQFVDAILRPAVYEAGE